MNPQKSFNSSTFKGMDHESVNKNALNTSTSKMQYSFPKSNRFADQYKSFSPDRYYQLPSTKMNRSTSFGYGVKVDLAKRNFVSPSPDRYKLVSDFQKGSKTGFTIAPGRQQVKANDMFYQPLKHAPQPATYSPKRIQGGRKFSIYPRLQDHTDKWVKSVPGPGQYAYLDLTSKGKSFLAKHHSVVSGAFDQLPRLSQTEMRKNKNPGPNQYKNSAEILNRYKYSIKGGNTFTKGMRKGIVDKSITPGPGKYGTFSEFA